MNLFINKAKNGVQTLYVHKKYRDENGKSTTKVIERLGTMEELSKLHDDPVVWANEYIKELNRKEKESSRKIMVGFAPMRQIDMDNRVLYCGGYLFLQKIYYELGLGKICRQISDRYKFEYNLDAVLSRLVFGRILSPSSKLSTMEYSKTLLEKPGFELQHIYRALEVLAKESDFIQAELYKNSADVSKRNDRVLYYDVTNYYFEMEEADGIKQYGYSKESRPNPIVSMGLLMDGDGIPLAFCINPGNTNEQTTLKPLERKLITDFDHSEFVICTDAGLSSYANRKFNSIMNRRFITVQSIKQMKQIQKDWALSPEGWRLPNSKKQYNLEDVKRDPEKYYDSIFFKEDYINENNLEQRIIVSFSLKYMQYMESLRERNLERARSAIDSRKVMQKRPADYKRFIEKTSYTDEGVVAENTTFSINESLAADEARYDGFYAVATNLEDSAEDIIRVNKGRWEIEECFRIMKHEFKARPVYLSRDDRIEAHFLTCFLALTIYRYLEKRLDYKYTCSEIINCLQSMDFYMIAGEGYVPVYMRSGLTDALHDCFGFRTDYEIISKSSMKKIFKFTKS